MAGRGLSTQSGHAHLSIWLMSSGYKEVNFDFLSPYLSYQKVTLEMHEEPRMEKQVQGVSVKHILI